MKTVVEHEAVHHVGNSIDYLTSERLFHGRSIITKSN